MEAVPIPRPSTPAAGVVVSGRPDSLPPSYEDSIERPVPLVVNLLRHKYVHLNPKTGKQHIGPRMYSIKDATTITRRTSYRDFILERFNRARELFDWADLGEPDVILMAVSIVVRISGGLEFGGPQDIACDETNWEAIREMLLKQKNYGRHASVYVALAPKQEGKLGVKERVRCVLLKGVGVVMGRPKF